MTPPPAVQSLVADLNCPRLMLPILDAVAGYYVGAVLHRHDVGDHVAFLVEAHDA